MSDFKLGQLIFQCKPYVYVLNNQFRGLRCDYCFKKCNGLKRCGQCTFTYYCNKKCQTEAWEDMHKTECKFIKKAEPRLPMPSLRILSHILFKIKKHGEDEPFEIIHGHKMSFRRLVSHKDEFGQNIETLKRDKPMMTLFAVLKSYLGEQNVPDLLKYIEIFGKMSVNTFSICDGEMQSIGTGMYLGASIFDHSCEPDAEVVFNGIDLQIRAVKDIPHKDVTKIYISYIEQIQLLEDRKLHFIEHYYFECQCIRCTTSKYEDLMTKTFTSKAESEAILVEFKDKTDYVKQMKKNNASPTVIYDYCMTELARLDDKLADTHIFRIKLLEYAFDACIDSNQWADATVIGKQLIEPYRLLYGEYQPAYGILLFKLGKIQNLQGLLESANSNLTKAEQTLRITHGTDHPLYKDLMAVMFECQLIL